MNHQKLERENQRRDEIHRNICALGMRKNKREKSNAIEEILDLKNLTRTS